MTFFSDWAVWGTVIGLGVYMLLLILTGMIYFVTFDPQYVDNDSLMAIGRACICLGAISGLAVAILQDE